MGRWHGVVRRHIKPQSRTEKQGVILVDQRRVFKELCLTFVLVLEVSSSKLSVLCVPAESQSTATEVFLTFNDIESIVKLRLLITEYALFDGPFVLSAELILEV